MQQAVSSYIKLIPFSSFNLWDVKRYYDNTQLEFENVVSLSEILIPYRKPVTKQEMIKNKWRIISKINFSGELFLRDFDEINTYKGNLNLVPEDAIIYSKINVRHGCIYYHAKGEAPFGVSSEYPTYKFDSSKVDGRFLHKLLRSDAFKKLLNTKTTGISKARVKQNEFLDTKIPLPSIDEQKRIVDNYDSKLQQSRILHDKALLLESETEHFLFEAVGYNVKSKSKANIVGKVLKVIDYESIIKWGIDQNNSSNLELVKPYQIFKIAELCKVSSGGTPSRDRKEYYNGNIPWIKTGEVLNDVIFDTEEKITKEAVDNSSARIYPRDSLIIAMYGQGLTRGRTAKLGIAATTNQACAVLFDINNSKVITDYLWVYLQGEYHRLRELASGNNQPNLNAQMIKEYRVVVPPISEQKAIVDGFFKRKAEIKDLNKQAEELCSLAEKEFEKQIFG